MEISENMKEPRGSVLRGTPGEVKGNLKNFVKVEELQEISERFCNIVGISGNFKEHRGSKWKLRKSLRNFGEI